MIIRLVYYSTCLSFFSSNDTSTTELYTLSLHDALPILQSLGVQGSRVYAGTFQEGVGRLDVTDGTWFNWYPTGCSGACPSDFLSSAFVFGMLVDHVGKKWVGCWSSALEEFDDSGPTPLFTHLWVGNDSPIDNHTWVWS